MLRVLEPPCRRPVLMEPNPKPAKSTIVHDLPGKRMSDQGSCRGARPHGYALDGAFPQQDNRKEHGSGFRSPTRLRRPRKATGTYTKERNPGIWEVVVDSHRWY